MALLERSLGPVSILMGVLASGIATPRVSHAQDAPSPEGSPSAAPVGDPNAPPAGNYPPPPPAGAPPAVQAPGGMAARSPLLAMPFVGFHSFQDSTSSGDGPGLRVGGLLGARLNEQFSLNGEVVLDVLNPKNVPAGEDVSAYIFQIAAAPFFHVPVASVVEFVIGPKLGFFRESASVSAPGYGSLNISGLGWLLGVNAGVFGRISDAISLGGLANFDYAKATSCSSDVGTCTLNDNAAKIVSFAAAALF
jgi:hypothetical protein